MSFTSIRAVVKTTLESVSGIGQVHDFRRHTTHWEEFYQRHVKDGRVNNWEITRTATEQELIAVQNAAGTEPFFHDTHDILILGHMALKDSLESEKTFQTLVDAVVAAFRVNNQLTGTLIVPVQMQGPVIDQRMFGPVLVHSAELRILAVERVGG